MENLNDEKPLKPEHWHEFDGLPLRIKDKNGIEIRVGDKLKVEWIAGVGVGIVKFGTAEAYDGCCCTVQMLGPYIDFGESEDCHHINPREVSGYEIVAPCSDVFHGHVFKWFPGEERIARELWEKRLEIFNPKPGEWTPPEHSEEV